MAFSPPSGEELTGRKPRGAFHALLLAILLIPLFIESMRQTLRVSVFDIDLEALSIDEQTRAITFTDTSGYIVDANLMLGTLGVIALWAGRFRIAYAVPFLCFTFFRLYVGVGRYSFIMVSASLLLLWLYDRRSKWPSLPHMAAGLAMLVLFSALGQSRDLIRTEIFGEASQPQDVVDTEKRNFFDALDLANNDFLEQIIAYVPERTGTYDFFANTLEVLTAPIPRVLWPDKPATGPRLTLQDLGTPIGFSYSLPGQGWLGLGLLGVVIWCGMAGAALGRLYSWFVGGVQSRFKIVCYLTLLPLTIQFFRDGTLLVALKFPMFPMLAILLWYGCQRLSSGKKRGALVRHGQSAVG